MKKSPTFTFICWPDAGFSGHLVRPMFRRLLSLLCLAAPLTGAEPAAPVTHAVLVHGIWQSEGRGFNQLRADLEKRGVTCLVPSLRPADGRKGLGTLALQLREEIDRTFAPDQRFVVIAFSMGGLVSRIYLQDLGGASRCDSLITISTPHHGTTMARFHYGQGAAEMRPDSVFISELEQGQDRLGKMPLVSYRTPYDAVIVPAESSLWERAENVEVRCPLHPMMTSSRKVRDDILGRFRFPTDG